MRYKIALKALVFTISTSFSGLILAAAIQLIAEPGQLADGFSSDFIYQKIDTDSAVIGSSGHIAFSGAAHTSLNSSQNKTNAVWAGLPGQLKVVIKENESPSGFPQNILFDSAVATAPGRASIVITKSGSIGVKALLKGATPGQGLLAHVNGTTFGVIRVGDQAPGFPIGTFIQDIGEFAFTDAGMVFTASVRISASSSQLAIWIWNFESINRILPSVADCNFISPLSPSINESGHVAFGSILDGASGLCPSGYGIFKWGNNVTERLLAENDPVPGMLNTHFSPIVLSSFISLKINDQGEVAFFTLLADSASPQGRAFSVWISDGLSKPKILVLSGETLAENSSKVIGVPFPLPIILNVGFTNDGFSIVLVPTKALGLATLLTGIPRSSQPYTSLTDTGKSQLTVVAEQNDLPPPGFDSTWFYSAFTGQAINRTGQYVFIGHTGNALGGNEVTGIWRSSGNSRPRLLAMEGMKVTVNGEERVLNRIGDGNASKFNTTTTGGNAARFSDNGHLVFEGTLSGRSGNSVLLITDDNQEQRIFALAEKQYPQYFFPANVDDRLTEGFLYRFYPTTNTYIGIKNGEVFVLGNVFGTGVQRIGTIENTLQFLEAAVQTGS